MNGSAVRGPRLPPDAATPAEACQRTIRSARRPLAAGSLRRALGGLALALLGLLGGCAASAPGPGHVMSYAYAVPPDVTFDLHRGQVLTSAEMDAQLAHVRLLFVGEHHEEARSHAFEREMIARLADLHRPVRVALEMFPPQVDPVLEQWRLGQLDERTFLERSGWYEHWGFPWADYRAVFELIRDRHLPVYGVNATNAVRKAVHAGKEEALPADVRALLGGMDAEVPPHAAYLLDILRQVGHGGGDLQPGTPTFRRFYRVQRMWDRLMGVRAARLAERQPADGITVLLVGSGHLAYGLGANLQAARETPLPQLTVWDAVVEPDELDAHGRYPVALGMADWARVYVRRGKVTGYPSLSPLALKAGAQGVEVEAVHAFGPTPLTALHAGDHILALNGLAPQTPTDLRLAYEHLPFGKPAHFQVLRKGKTITVTVTPQPSEF